MDTRLGSISGLLRQAREETVEVAASAAVRAVEAANGQVAADDAEMDRGAEQVVAKRELDGRSRRHSTRWVPDRARARRSVAAGVKREHVSVGRMSSVAVREEVV